MGKNRLFISLGVVAVLLVGAIFAMRRPSGDAVERPRDAWSRIDRTQVTRLIIQRAGANERAVEIEKRSDVWTMTAPAQGPADTQAVTDALDQISEMRVESIAARESSSYDDLEVDAAHAIHLQVFRGATRALDVWVGRNIDGGTAVRVEGRREVFRVDRSIRNTLSKEVREWRDRNITRIDRTHIRTVEWRNANGTWTFNRNGDTWQLPSGAPAIERLDTARVNQTIENLRELRATDFAAATASTGITDNSPRVTITTDDGGAPLVLILGSNAGESEVHVQRQGSPIVYTVGRSHSEEINVTLERFQSPPPAPEGGTGDASTDAAGSPAPIALPMGGGGPPGAGGPPGGPGGQQIPPEMMERIRAQLQQRGVNMPH